MVFVNKRSAKATQRQEKSMNCPKCKGTLRRTEVAVRGASSKVISHQCENCDYFLFEPQSSQKAIDELRK